MVLRCYTCGFNCGYLDLNVCYYGRQTVNIILNSNSQNNLISPYKIRLTFLQMLLFLIMNIYICILTQATVHSSYCQLGLGDISHVICMRISSVKPAPWLAVNLHHLFSNGVAIHRAVDHWQAMQYRFHYRRWIAFDMNVILRRLSVIYRPALLSNMHFYSTLYIASNHSHMRLNLHSGRLNDVLY